MRQLVTISIVVLSVFLLSCKNEKQKTVESLGYEVEYAKGFSVVKSDNYTIVNITNPWDTAKILETYILVNKNKELPAGLPEGTLVRIPVENVVLYSSVHCAAFKELQSLNVVKGVCEPEYINTQEIKDGVANGSILNLGKASSPDIEKIIDLNPDAIFAAPISGTSFGQIEKMNIPLVQTPDYMEQTSLGWAEWLRLYSLFLDKEELADSLFNITRNNYIEIRDKINNEAKNKPLILTDTKYENTWYIAGGKSFVVNMYRDAGAKTPWDEDNSSGSLPLAFETVLDKAEKADIWLIKYNNKEDMTYQELENTDKGYSQFEAFKNRNIYACNMGYINYYEDLPIHPDWVLKDLAAIFHPELYPEYTLKYYSRLK